MPVDTAHVAGVTVDTRHWMGGRRVGSAETFTDISPVDERPIADVARGGQDEVVAAVAAARDAFPAWAATPPADRAKALHGNTVVAKPPEWAPLTASLLADITREAGLPDGVFNVVQGLGTEAGAPLVAHPDLARVAFTGSVATGRQVAAAAGAQLTPVSLELERVDGFVRRAIAAGARPLLGGAVNPVLGGLYYQPTLLGGARPGSEILTEEVFGPVLTLQTFSGEDEAVAMANDTRYGLAATMFTGDRDRAERVSARLVAGTVWVNCFFVRDLRAPFGGSGRSGIGREGGTWSFDFYSDVKNTVYAAGGWSSDG